MFSISHFLLWLPACVLICTTAPQEGLACAPTCQPTRGSRTLALAHACTGNANVTKSRLLARAHRSCLSWRQHEREHEFEQRRRVAYLIEGPSGVLTSTSAARVHSAARRALPSAHCRKWTNVLVGSQVPFARAVTLLDRFEGEILMMGQGVHQTPSQICRFAALA